MLSKIEEFVKNDRSKPKNKYIGKYGDEDRSGYGSGDGDGYGNGYGSGYGDGEGSGHHAGGEQAQGGEVSGAESGAPHLPDPLHPGKGESGQAGRLQPSPV